MYDSLLFEAWLANPLGGSNSPRVVIGRRFENQADERFGSTPSDMEVETFVMHVQRTSYSTKTSSLEFRTVKLEDKRDEATVEAKGEGKEDDPTKMGAKEGVKDEGHTRDGAKAEAPEGKEGMKEEGYTSNGAKAEAGAEAEAEAEAKPQDSTEAKPKAEAKEESSKPTFKYFLYIESDDSSVIRRNPEHAIRSLTEKVADILSFLAHTDHRELKVRRVIPSVRTTGCPSEDLRYAHWCLGGHFNL